MRKILFLTFLGLLIAAPLTAQATTSIEHLDSGPFDWSWENPCTPGDWIELEYYVKGTRKRTENSQGVHYVVNLQYTGGGVGSETGLVFTLHNPAHTHRFSNFDNQMVSRHQDEIMLVGKGEKGVEQIIEWTYLFDVWQILPDGTPHKDYIEWGDPACKKK